MIILTFHACSCAILFRSRLPFDTRNEPRTIACDRIRFTLFDLARFRLLIANHPASGTVLRHEINAITLIQRIAIAFIIGIGAFRIGILATRLFATALGFAADLVATGLTAILCVRFAIAVASDEFVRAIAHFDASLRFAFGDALKRCIANFVLFSAILLDFVAIGIARDSCRRILAAGLARVNRARATRAVVASCHRNRHCRNCR